MAAGETEKEKLTAAIGFPIGHMPGMLYVSFMIFDYRLCAIPYPDRGSRS